MRLAFELFLPDRHCSGFDSALSAKLASLGNQVLLAHQSAFELGDGSIRALRFFLCAASEAKIDDPHDRGESEDGPEPDLQAAVERECVARHFLRDRERLERSVCDLLAFFSDSRLRAKLRFGALRAELSPHPREKLARFPRS